MSREGRLHALLIVTLMVIAGEPLLAHEQGGQVRGFLTGMLHPVSGPDHVLAMIAASTRAGSNAPAEAIASHSVIDRGPSQLR